MTSEKVPYGHLMPERSPRRERTGGPLGSLAGVLGAASVFVSAVVLAVIVQNIGHEMGNLRAKVERDQEEMAKLQALAQRDHDEMAKLQERVATLAGWAEKDQNEVLSLRERIVVLETQIRGGSFPPNFAEQQQPSASPEGEQSGHGETDTGVQNNNATLGGVAHRRSKRDTPNWVRLPSGSGCCQTQAGLDGRDGRDGTVGAPGPKGEPGQKGDTAGAKGSKGETGIRGPKGLKGTPGNVGVGAKGSKGELGTRGPRGFKGTQGTPGNNGLGGAVYTRWGRKTCPSGATTVYSGVAGGTHYNQPGGGSNYQCLPTNPQWGSYQDGVQGDKAHMWGAEYQLTSNYPFGSTPTSVDNVPCAVCYVPTRGSKLMIPARNTCPTGWTEEYDGYLMAEHHANISPTEYVCMDEHPEVIQGGYGNQNGALFNPVEARCGSLPCPSYVEGRELTCPSLPVENDVGEGPVRPPHAAPERRPRRERTGGPLGSLAGVLGAAAVFVSAVALAVIVQNIGHEMGNLRAKVDRDQEEMAKLQERVATFAQVAGRAEGDHVDMAKLQARAERDQEEMAKLQERVTTLTVMTESLKLRAERDHDDMTKLQARDEVLSLRERIVVLETQIRGGSFPPNYAEQQQPSASPEGEQSGHGETDTGVQNNNATLGGVAHRRSKRDAPANYVRLPPGLGCCQTQAGRDGRDGRDGTAGAPGPKVR
ncbi:COL6A5 [Branchiostoma lanceolatum]|uniref:COL6A5 protein n=1 Tax=Branchiostoma lanceolatum TaxID=7740 RepID=A0A8J9VY58_BRALA|nr:COL6A5 [Branchiostoma lanceolatum]